MYEHFEKYEVAPPEEVKMVAAVTRTGLNARTPQELNDLDVNHVWQQMRDAGINDETVSDEAVNFAAYLFAQFVANLRRAEENIKASPAHSADIGAAAAAAVETAYVYLISLIEAKYGTQKAKTVEELLGLSEVLPA